MALEICEKEIKMLKSNIEEIYEGTDEELREEINVFNRKFEESAKVMSEVTLIY